jgi:hypothetical protein
MSERFIRDLICKEAKKVLGKQCSHSSYSYVTSEVYYELCGSDAAFHVMKIKHEGVTHFFLKDKGNEEICDLSGAYFSSDIPYEQAEYSHFTTKGRPSKKARKVLESVEKDIELIKAAYKYFDDNCTHTHGVTRAELFKELPDKITGNNLQRFSSKMARFSKAEVFPGFIVKQRIGTIKAPPEDEENKKEVAAIATIIDDEFKEAPNKIVKADNKEIDLPKINTKPAHSEITPLVLNSLVQELTEVQLRINQIQQAILVLSQ